MNSNNWYPQQNYDARLQGSPQAPIDRIAADSVHDAQRLLAVYPMASATPSNHGRNLELDPCSKHILSLCCNIVARHLGSMSIGAPMPSYIQPQYHGSSYGQGNPPPYTEYAHEVDYLASHQVPLDDSGYWETTRNDALSYLGDQPGSCVYFNFSSNI